MTVQKKWMTFLLILCILVTAMSTAFLLQPTAASESAPPAGPIYLLRDDHGFLALYDPDALREGIPVYTDSELERLIEDYGG